MPSYKLTYFDGRGRAEPSRMLFALAGQKFEDYRVVGEEWKTLKAKMPLGQIPVLEVDGEALPQSKAITGYLAREFGLFGSNNWEAAQVDASVVTIDELFDELAVVYRSESDPQKRDEAVQKFISDVVPKKLERISKLLRMYGKGYLVGNKISVADVYFHCVMEVAKKGDLTKFPELSALSDKISSHERLAPYLKSRPESPW